VPARGAPRGGPPGAGRGGTPPGVSGGAGAPRLFGPGAAAGGAPGGAAGFGFAFGGRAGGAPAGGFGGALDAAVLSYVKAHGGGTIAVSSQSSAADSIIAQHANVAGIGGFSGRESDARMWWTVIGTGNAVVGWDPVLKGAATTQGDTNSHGER